MNENITHQEILDKSLAMLERGATNRKDDFHTPVFGTIGLKDEPELRVVVFRKIVRQPRMLVCHSDLRSPKIAELARDARVSWLFYHVAEKLQLRVRGRATVHTSDELADAQWQNTQLFSRRCYCGDAPGTSKGEPSSGLPGFLVDREPTAEESERLGRKNFAVISSTIDELDVYELNFNGHRRSLFAWNEAGELETRWLTP